MTGITYDARTIGQPLACCGCGGRADLGARIIDGNPPARVPWRVCPSCAHIDRAADALLAAVREQEGDAAVRLVTRAGCAEVIRAAGAVQFYRDRPGAHPMDAPRTPWSHVGVAQHVQAAMRLLGEQAAAERPAPHPSGLPCSVCGVAVDRTARAPLPDHWSVAAHRDESSPPPPLPEWAAEPDAVTAWSSLGSPARPACAECANRDREARAGDLLDGAGTYGECAAEWHAWAAFGKPGKPRAGLAALAGWYPAHQAPGYARGADWGGRWAYLGEQQLAAGREVIESYEDRETPEELRYRELAAYLARQEAEAAEVATARRTEAERRAEAARLDRVEKQLAEARALGRIDEYLRKARAGRDRPTVVTVTDDGRVHQGARLIPGYRRFTSGQSAGAFPPHADAAR